MKKKNPAALFSLSRLIPPSLSRSSFLASADDRQGEWRRPCQSFVGRFAGRQGYVRPFPSLRFLLFEIEHPNPYLLVRPFLWVAMEEGPGGGTE